MTFDELRNYYFHLTPYEPGAVKLNEYSDIVLHLPVLQYYASLCEHVTEFGVRDAHSTVALLAGKPNELHSFDICRTRAIDLLEQMRNELPCRWVFTLLDTGYPGTAHMVGDTDLLFIDTLHTYEHVKKELALHGRKARKYLAFHDTYTCGLRDLSGPDPHATGILPAINEFLAQYPGEYETVYRTDANNGLWVLKKNF